jgi:AAA+ superfamily predicted ATPase
MTTIMTEIKTIYTQNIQPPLLQIANSEFVNYVNTGDKIKDSAIVLILNSVLLILIKFIYKSLENTYCFLYNNVSNKNDDDNYNFDTDLILSKYKVDDITKYKFQFNLLKNISDASRTFTEWCNYKKIKLNVSTSIDCSVKINYTKYMENDGTVLYMNENQFNKLITPVYKYKNNNDYEYIFVDNGTIYSNDLIHLNKFIKEYLKDYDYIINLSKLKDKTENKICEIDYSRFVLMEQGNINKDIVLDSIYFDEKQKIIQWIDKFKDNKMYPKGLSLVNKIGILLYGPPGTGKTGLISSIANYLNRSILLINALNIKNESQNKLKDIINKTKNTHIIVFDEFDYILNSKISNENEMEKYTDMLSNTNDITEKKQIMTLINSIKTDYNTSTIDNRFILSLLDGIGSDDGRIIIATTNNPEKINPAFIRPGRFDIKIKMGFCSFNMFKDIVKTKYETLTDEFFIENIEKINTILKLNITPLVLINNLIESIDVNNMFSMLMKLKQQNYEKEIG